MGTFDKINSAIKVLEGILEDGLSNSFVVEAAIEQLRDIKDSSPEYKFGSFYEVIMPNGDCEIVAESEIDNEEFLDSVIFESYEPSWWVRVSFGYGDEWFGPFLSEEEAEQEVENFHEQIV